MSGHSKWSSIKHKKGAADAKRGKIFKGSYGKTRPHHPHAAKKKAPVKTPAGRGRSARR